MIKCNLLMICALTIPTLTHGEFNIVDNTGRPAYINAGYRNAHGYLICCGNDKNTDLKQKTLNLPDKDISILLSPSLHNNNPLKGKDYYFLNYDIFYILNGIRYKMPFTIPDARAIGTSIIYNDANISIFTLERYQNPVSNNNSKEFSSKVYIINKKNIGVYEPIFLYLNTTLESISDISLKFSKLDSVKYDKAKNAYSIVFEIQNAPEDFTTTGRVVYEKSPVQHSFTLIPAQNKPFIIKNYIEKRKDSKKIISTDDLYGLEYYFLKKK
ncbi:hypothetical protein [Alkanindiges illinoisensis]|uniref:Uncharacterized protein n=1 Tax=Alkanindiges illinoisensis TaxID=197183 RepID=A0A4Y7XC54_9GAMM|nr:hypothetical protein [Alkanindiges illinoisensis]TEU26861.1 hypothetical protein E2B99_07590 [Alkanindiges illinoisensis]